MKPRALRDALRATVEYCKAAAEKGQPHELHLALAFMAGHVGRDDPESAELLQALVEATR